MGHALVALALPGSDVIHKVSIIPRGIGSLGYTIRRPTDERYLMTREELENKIAVLLGGRAAEKVVFGELSTGAADGLAKGHRHSAVDGRSLRHGRTARLCRLRRRPRGLPRPAQSHGLFRAAVQRETAREVDIAVRETIGLAFDKAVGILTENREVLERSAKRLLGEETLDEAAIGELTKDLRTARTPAALAG